MDFEAGQTPFLGEGNHLLIPSPKLRSTMGLISPTGWGLWNTVLPDEPSCWKRTADPKLCLATNCTSTMPWTKASQSKVYAASSPSIGVMHKNIPMVCCFTILILSLVVLSAIVNMSEPLIWYIEAPADVFWLLTDEGKWHSRVSRTFRILVCPQRALGHNSDCRCTVGLRVLPLSRLRSISHTSVFQYSDHQLSEIAANSRESRKAVVMKISPRADSNGVDFPYQTMVQPGRDCSCSIHMSLHIACVNHVQFDFRCRMVQRDAFPVRNKNATVLAQSLAADGSNR